MKTIREQKTMTFGVRKMTAKKILSELIDGSWKGFDVENRKTKIVISYDNKLIGILTK